MPNHLAWLCMFYILFHSWLNLVGEILHFADRSFYSDWWNSNNIDLFWRNWNLPVHRWAVRHLYIPLVDMGYSRNIAATTVFFISAFFHEYMVSVPLKTYKIWAFAGMMAQIPLSNVSKYVEKQYGPRFGNIVVWASLIIGQPLAIMMYYHDYVVDHFGKSLIEDYSHVWSDYKYLYMTMQYFSSKDQIYLVCIVFYCIHILFVVILYILYIIFLQTFIDIYIIHRDIFLQDITISCLQLKNHYGLYH